MAVIRYKNYGSWAQDMFPFLKPLFLFDFKCLNIISWVLQSFFRGLRTTILTGSGSEGSRAAMDHGWQEVSFWGDNPDQCSRLHKKVGLQWLLWGRGSCRGPHVLYEEWGMFHPTGFLNRLPLVPNCFSHLSVLSNAPSLFWLVTQTCSLHLLRQDGSMESWGFSSVTANF